MLKKIFITTICMALSLAGCKSPEPEIPSPSPETTPSPKVSIEIPEKPLTLPPDNPEKIASTQVQTYLSRLANQGFSQQNQGIWIQSNDTLLANYQGTIPLPAASITKVATSLVALKTFNPDHQFITLIGTTGTIENGVLNGDLVIQGGEDPFFVWEEAIAIGNLLNQMGIQRVTGNLIITGKFYMNFESNPQTAGNLLRQGLNSQIWSSEVLNQYQTLPPDTAKPQVIIDGVVAVSLTHSENIKLLVRHYSFPMAELVKKMNQYSNNLMADMLAEAVGGYQVVAEKAAEFTGVPKEEIQLINGSGLGEENRISPRAATGMFLAIDKYLQQYNMNVADVFVIVGKDKGILDERKQLPNLAVVKSGTLDYVSALAGALPTKEKGVIWFTILNKGASVTELRNQQEILLKDVLNNWGYVDLSPANLTANPERKTKTSRSEIIQ
ncbi:MAG: D-alanyl-D-alanine carboxypeptidase [Okeania sp. SIO2G4]|uniref:D-alanyl-D-alanine carboxypeptidase n=2 Tax=Okeania TaxID=1458928 RepID=UPI0013BD7B7A|nr:MULTISPECIES: D-alanyl-D-alanine carboxypeptidase [unclassified Okeania]NEP38504.1 D-alanyl-D-alanine carboxypeptidase [Okeania sp. SIO2H7]NEP75582.1 D-alanyl-D-alanine carboxypeptidase [Okeania sp. SIO2G5]NEP96709.1 D-alanyl-D-alanine carboxypeptidase [Okeania sp. SIO2F5]NEQ94419.1 D-alanyl-D-alanine carboxypeptidase [Okeania sp. SIO2G4]